MPPSTSTREIVVSTADCRFAAPGSRLVSRNIGPEIAIAVHIPELEIAALLNCALPHFLDNSYSDRNPWLYADTAIPLLLRRIDAHGVNRSSIRVRAVGGATPTGSEADTQWADQNVAAVCDTLHEEGVVLESTDFGGTSLRSLWFEPRDGRLIVRTHAPARNTLPLPGYHSPFYAPLIAASR